MTTIETLFHLHRAQSGLFSDYAKGDVPYVGNGLSDNAVVGFVKPRPGDKVFGFRGVVISAFCEATVQAPPFVACGRAGNGLVALEPRSQMSARQLAYIAAYINITVRWRFNWYRQTTAERLRRLPLPDIIPDTTPYDVIAALPQSGTTAPDEWQMQLRPFALGDLYTLKPGDYHSLSAIPPGNVPIVSCGDTNNGISGFYDVKSNLYQDRLTIAFNGMNTLTAKYHPYRFAAKDDVAICLPVRPLRLSTEIFVQTMLGRERWRYSYYRKCYAEKMRRFAVLLPAKGSDLDEDTMEAVIRATPYWKYIEQKAQRPTIYADIPIQQ